jgi:hypothetical protein
MILKLKTEYGSISLIKTKGGNFLANTTVTQFESYTTPCMAEDEALKYLLAAAQRELAQAQKFFDLVSELQKAQEPISEPEAQAEDPKAREELARFREALIAKYRKPKK